MIETLKIENFKSLKKETFNFGKLNVITGVNSAGKSSVLQSLFLMADALKEKKTEIDYFWKKEQRKFLSEMNRLKTLKQYIDNNKDKVDEYSANKLINILESQYSRFIQTENRLKKYELSANQKLKTWKFETIRNRKENAKFVGVTINGANCVLDSESCILKNDDLKFEKNKDFFYLSENRSGPANREVLIESDEFGDNAEFVIGYFYRHQNDTISSDFAITENLTLSSNVDLWLTEILKNDDEDFNISLNVEKIDSDTVASRYDFCGLHEIEPTQLGAGVSYLAKLLIVCLQAKPGQLVIVENPEMHLHPKAQSAVGHFLSFIASKGVQVIIETHCEHLIHKIQYDVYKKLLKPEDVCIYYKKSSISDFDKMTIGLDGHFQKDGHRQRFPKGFFDASLAELLEMG